MIELYAMAGGLLLAFAYWGLEEPLKNIIALKTPTTKINLPALGVGVVKNSTKKQPARKSC